MQSLEHRPHAMLIFGPPGSGKGTVGSKLAATTELIHLSTGNIFRGMPATSVNGRLAAEYSNAGKLVPDEVSLQIFSRYLSGMVDTNQLDHSKHMLLLDGIPRTPRQAELLAPVVDVRLILVLEIKNEEMLVQRILKRARIENRPDDADETVVRRRMVEYHQKTEAVLNCFPQDLIKRINGENSPVEVFRDALIASVDCLKAFH